MNPVSMMIYVWIFTIAAHAVYFKEEKYTVITYGCIFFGVLFFVFGFLMFHKRVIKGWEKVYFYNYREMRRILKLLTFIEIVRLVYIIGEVYKIAGSIDTFIYNNTWVRIQYLDRNMSFLQAIFEFFTNANAFIGYVVLGIYIAKKQKWSTLYVVVWTLIEVLYAAVSMSKMCLVLYLVVLGVTYLNNIGTTRKQKSIFIKYVPLIAIGVFFFLMFIATQRNYSVSNSSLIEIVFRKAVFYFSSGIEGLAKYMYFYESDLEMGSNTFSVLARIFARMGMMSDTSVLLHAEYVDTIYEPTNVYTWFRTFYLDYSYFGFIIMPFLIGAISGIFYNPNIHNLFLDVCSSWISALVAISFYSFLWGQTVYIFILVYAYFLHNVFLRKLYIDIKK